MGDIKIVEIGINHNGDVNIAKKLIDVASSLDVIIEISKEQLIVRILKIKKAKCVNSLGQNYLS